MRTAAALALVFLSCGVEVKADAAFTPQECARIYGYWNAPGRYRVGPSPQHSWQRRLTVDGSRWFLAYQAAVSASAIPPTRDAAGSADKADWETWVKAKLEYDRWSALGTAETLNGHPTSTTEAPPLPGIIPPTLLAAVGNPPVLSAPAYPLEYTVDFGSGVPFVLHDNVAVRPRFAYYRFPQGVAVYGKSLSAIPASELDGLFGSANMSSSEQKIVRAVSAFEGDFESVNTYDTGFVSVGFIQFTTGENGTGSLCGVLERERAEQPADFTHDFHDYGVDVGFEHSVHVVDPTTGAELSGPAAVQKIIDDKRLIAVFERAGRSSRSFRISQIETAKAAYWPGDLPIRIPGPSGDLVGKVSDVVHSEAGLATLFDRRVNRGNIRPFEDLLNAVIRRHNLTSLSAASAYEKEIISQMQYRSDFLADVSLGQPPEPPPPPPPSPVPQTPGKSSPAVVEPGDARPDPGGRSAGRREGKQP